jgi:hypothetical protein
MIQRELVDNKHPEETMHQVGTELKQIYPASASGRGDAIHGNKNRE